MLYDTSRYKQWKHNEQNSSHYGLKPKLLYRIIPWSMKNALYAKIINVYAVLMVIKIVNLTTHAIKMFPVWSICKSHCACGYSFSKMNIINSIISVLSELTPWGLATYYICIICKMFSFFYWIHLKEKAQSFFFFFCFNRVCYSLLCFCNCGTQCLVLLTQRHKKKDY